MARDLDPVDPASTVDVIVKFKEVPTEGTHQRMLSHGARQNMNLHSVRSALMSVRGSDLAALADSPEAEFIFPDRAVSTSPSGGSYL